MNAPEQTASRADVMNAISCTIFRWDRRSINPLRTATRAYRLKRTGIVTCLLTQLMQGSMRINLAADSAIDVKLNYRGDVSTQVVNRTATQTHPVGYFLRIRLSQTEQNTHGPTCVPKRLLVDRTAGGQSLGF